MAMTRACVLCGGVGAARFLTGLVRVIPPEDIGCIVNTGDDIDVWGARVCPDVDIVTYTLAGIVDRDKGWGVAGDTFTCLEAMVRLKEMGWFRLGDADLALSLVRTQLLGAGRELEDAIAEIVHRLGVVPTIVPMSNERVETRVTTPAGEMSFEEYFVREGCRPEVRKVRYAGADIARPSRGAGRLIRESDVPLIAPSNPLASIGPILAVPGMRELVETFNGPRIAVSPLIGGKTIKGPADRMLRAAGFPPSVEGLATFYDGLIDGFVIDEVDSSSIPVLEGRGLAVHALPSLMDTPARAEAVARGALKLAEEIERP